MNWNKILIGASYFGHLEIAKLAIENGADIHADDNPSLRNACKYGYTDIVALLIKNGAKVHIYNNAPLKWSSNYGFNDIVKILLKANANYDDAYRWNEAYNHKIGIDTLRRAKHELESERNSLKAS